MTVGRRNDQNIVATMERAIELTEEALAEVARIAVEGIHCGLEASSHVQAAERDMRSALRQLVLAERELHERGQHSSRRFEPELGERAEGVAEVMPGPGSDAARRGI